MQPWQAIGLEAVRESIWRLRSKEHCEDADHAQLVGVDLSPAAVSSGLEVGREREPRIVLHGTDEHRHSNRAGDATGCASWA